LIVPTIFWICVDRYLIVRPIVSTSNACVIDCKCFCCRCFAVLFCFNFITIIRGEQRWLIIDYWNEEVIFFSNRIVNIWNSLSNAVVDVDAIDLFKSRLENVGCYTRHQAWLHCGIGRKQRSIWVWHRRPILMSYERCPNERYGQKGTQEPASVNIISWLIVWVIDRFLTTQCFQHCFCGSLSLISHVSRMQTPMAIEYSPGKLLVSTRINCLFLYR